MLIEEAFGITLKKYRTNFGISQEELALRCGLDRTFISLLERGKRNATIVTLFKISKTLEFNPSDFIKEIEGLL